MPLLHTAIRVGRVERDPGIWTEVWAVFDPQGVPVERFEGTDAKAAAEGLRDRLNDAAVVTKE